MSYIKGTLSEDEQIKEHITLHWLNFLPAALFALIAMVCALIGYIQQQNGELPTAYAAAALFFILSLYIYLPLAAVEMAVTNKRVICKKGIVSVHSEELYNGKVESIEIRQSIMGRLFGYGTICFSGTGDSTVEFVDIDNPRETKARIETIVYNPENR